MTWENAFFQQYQDAYTGRLIRGIVHNLNGVNQAFLLQSTLFKSMFTKAHKLVDCIHAGTDVDESLNQLKDLLHKRSIMAAQMEEKVAVSHNIVKRIQPIFAMYKEEGFKGTSISSIVNMETEFLCADSFFKHKIERHYDLRADLPMVVKNVYNIHFLISTLFVNSIDALQDAVNPQILLHVFCHRGSLFLEVSDNGSGVDTVVADTIFESFVTTKKGHLGLGLYVLSKHLSTSGGSIGWRHDAGKTVFQVSLPLVDL